jgi:hypothetical protein
MEFLRVVAHLLHSFKAHVTFVTFVESLFMHQLLVLHQILDLMELASADFAFVFLKHVITPLFSGYPSTSCIDYPEYARPVWDGSRTYPAFHRIQHRNSLSFHSLHLFSGSMTCTATFQIPSPIATLAFWHLP